VSVVLYRIDDRLIHGQVVVGWAQRLGVGFIVLVDEEVYANLWEQELYRMGVPPSMEVVFTDVAGAAAQLGAWELDERKGIVLTGRVDTMAALCPAMSQPRRVNLGGLHARDGRSERLRYVFLSPDEARTLKALSDGGVEISAQDVPTAKPVPLAELL
jgi:mannose/fructose/N-acetylgalactosamine-specific phosphotransferase system component IIB